MLIKAELASRLDDDLFRKIAIEYTNNMAALFGHTEQISLARYAVFYSTESAIEHYKALCAKWVSTPEHARLSLMLEAIETGRVDSFADIGVANVAVTPLTDPYEDWVVELLMDKVGGIDKTKYMLVLGFECEMGHLTSFEVVGRNIGTGLSECFDYAAQYHCIERDWATLGCGPGQCRILSEVQGDFITDVIIDIRSYELAKTVGYSAGSAYIISQGEFSSEREARDELEGNLEHYGDSCHYEGAKLFLEAFELAGGNYGDACLNLGKIFGSKPSCVREALGMLGVPKDRIYPELLTDG